MTKKMAGNGHHHLGIPCHDNKGKGRGKSRDQNRQIRSSPAPIGKYMLYINTKHLLMFI